MTENARDLVNLTIRENVDGRTPVIAYGLTEAEADGLLTAYLHRTAKDRDGSPHRALVVTYWRFNEPGF